MGFFSGLGWLAFIVGVCATILAYLNIKGAPEFLKRFKDWKFLAVYDAIVLVFILSGELFFIAKPGTAYAVQYPWGGDQAITSQGFKTKWFGRLIPISFEIAIQDTLGNVHTQDEIYYRRARPREFSDAIKADVATSIVISVNYQDEEGFLEMADKNRSEEKLVYARIISVYDQALKNTCKLMSAQEYINGASAQFDYYLRDQLENGMYLTEEVYEESSETPIFDSLANRTVATSLSDRQKTKKYVIKYDKQGQPIRDLSNSLHKYGLTVQQAAVTSIDWEGAFDKRLDQQKEQVASTQLEKQKAEKEYYAMQAAIQKGEREKAEEQKKLEKEQITKIIAAETAAKQAEWKVTEETNLLAASKKQAERIRVEAEAESYKNRNLVSAGLTPQERAEWDYKTAVGVAEQLKELKLPQVYIGQDAKPGGTLLESLIGAEMAKQLLGKQ